MKSTHSPTIILNQFLLTALFLGVVSFSGATAQEGRLSFMPPTYSQGFRQALISGTAPRLAGLGQPEANDFSPVDTVKMSGWERIWWGRHGIMRIGFKLDKENPVNDLRQMARVRRKMLSLHQTLGLITVASMAVTVAGGLKADSGKGSGLHKASVPITIGLYSATAALSLTSPPKLVPSRRGWDTIRVHKLMAIFHFAGMIITPLLAPDNPDAAVKWHRTAGIATFATFSAGMLTVMLFR